MRNFLKKNSGFTMAEAIVVMTILGIIATIMLTTMKPAKFKEEAMEILARQTLADLDTALNMVMLNDCPSGNLNKCNVPWSNRTFSMAEKTKDPDRNIYTQAQALGILLQKYMAVSREPAKMFNEGTYANPKNRPDLFKLKNGVEIDIDRNLTGNKTTWIPGEKQGKAINFSGVHYGVINVDINAYDEGPNVLGKDRYIIPLCENGIVGGD